MAKNIPDEPNVRREKLKKLMAANVEPYPARCQVTHRIGEARQLPLESANICVAGRLMSIRTMGKLAFAHLHDGSGKIQVQLDVTIGAKAFQQFVELIDPGDFISVCGTLMKTKTGELTVKATGYALLSKTLRPLPEKWAGLKEHELRYRKRYLDLLANADVRKLFEQRSAFIAAFRRYFNRHHFLEVETPVLELIPGGAEAQPFTTHHETLDLDLHLRISLELHLKRLVVGGLDRVYEIGKVFRNEGMSREHLQEFTLLEFYQAYADYRDLIARVQDCYRTVLLETFQTLEFTYQGTKLNFKTPWPEASFVAALQKETGVDVTEATLPQLTQAVRKCGGTVEPGAGRGRLIDQLYKKTLRLKIIHPTVLYDLPVEVSPLAKRKADNPQLAERITIVAGGTEIGNGFSELNDPLDQRERFAEQAKLREDGDREAQMMDEDFVEALEHGMPPTAGFGVGLDRLFMLLTDQPSIRDVVLFPTMRPIGDVGDMKPASSKAPAFSKLPADKSADW